MKTVVHYLPGGKAARSEFLRQAIKVGHASGLRVGVTFGNGVMFVPLGYELVWAAGGKVAMRTPAGALVVYGPKRARREHAARAFVRISPGFGLDHL